MRIHLHSNVVADEDDVEQQAMAKCTGGRYNDSSSPRISD